MNRIIKALESINSEVKVILSSKLSSKLRCCIELSESSNCNLAAFFGLGLEDEDVSILPDLNNVGLTWEDVREETGR